VYEREPRESLLQRPLLVLLMTDIFNIFNSEINALCSERSHQEHHYPLKRVEGLPAMGLKSENEAPEPVSLILSLTFSAINV
jgi:hypothetical protein